MVKECTVRCILLSVVVLCWAESAAAQITYRVQHQSPALLVRDEPVQLSFEVPGLNPGQVQDAFLYYKYDGAASYRQLRATQNQSSFSVQFEIDNPGAGVLEYYFAIETTDREQIAYPSSMPQGGPIRVDIVDRDEQPVTATESSGIEYTILSPEPGSEVSGRDVLVAITLFYEEGAIDTTTSSFRFFLDGEDITEEAEATDYFFSYAPSRLPGGEHRAELRLQNPGETVTVAGWSFNVTSSTTAGVAEPEGVVAAAVGARQGGLTPEGVLQLTARNQQIGDLGNNVLKGNFRLSGSNGQIRYSAHGLLTSQESGRLQPQNRYGAELYVGNWLEFRGGHIYPTLSDLTITGRRIQGIDAGFHVLNRSIHARFLYGKMNRSIANLYGEVVPGMTLSNGIPVDTTYALNFDNSGIGTYQRNVIGGRLAFGRGENFQLGFNMLQVRDDTNSISVIDNYSDLLAQQPGLADGLAPEYRNDLEANGDLLNVTGNPQPKDNLVAGTDLSFSLFNNQVRFRTEGGMSLLNEDITGGVLTSDNNLGVNVDEDLTNLLDQLSWLIIINQNMNTLPFRFDVQGDNTEVEGYFPTGILASESELNLNLFENDIRFEYRWIGPDYVSLANSTVRRDLAGYSVSDRFRLMDNSLYVTLGYENLNDNVIGTKDATTRTQTLRTNFSWFPIEPSFPRVSFGVMYRNRDNEVPLFNPYLSGPGIQQDLAIRNFETQSGDTVIASNPRLTNTFQISTTVSKEFDLLDMTHNASLNFSYFNTKDDYFRYGDNRNNSISLNVRSNLNELPLRTHIGFSINNTETLGGLSDVNILGLNVGGSMYFLDDQLNVSADIAFTSNRTESTPLEVDDNDTESPLDDFYAPGTDSFGNPVTEEIQNNLYIFRAEALYNLTPQHSFMVNFSYTNVANRFSGLNPPNDHMLQAQYIFRF